MESIFLSHGEVTELTGARVKVNQIQVRKRKGIRHTIKVESSGDIRQVRDQLGHTTVVMTEQYIRQRKGKKITPTR